MEDQPTQSLIRVLDVDHVLEFQGELVADVTTEVPHQSRWTEMELYRLTDGTGRYVVHIVGRSVLYHVHDGECNSGSATDAAELPDDAEPCSTCKPNRDLVDGEILDFEVDRHSAYVCGSAAEALGQLRSTGARAAVRPFSAPALRLINSARQKDDAIEAIMSAVERI